MQLDKELRHCWNPWFYNKAVKFYCRQPKSWKWDTENYSNRTWYGRVLCPSWAAATETLCWKVGYIQSNIDFILQFIFKFGSTLAQLCAPYEYHEIPSCICLIFAGTTLTLSMICPFQEGMNGSKSFPKRGTYHRGSDAILVIFLAENLKEMPQIAASLNIHWTPCKENWYKMSSDYL